MVSVMDTKNYKAEVNKVNSNPVPLSPSGLKPVPVTVVDPAKEAKYEEQTRIEKAKADKDEAFRLNEERMLKDKYEAEVKAKQVEEDKKQAEKRQKDLDETEKKATKEKTPAEVKKEREAKIKADAYDTHLQFQMNNPEKADNPQQPAVKPAPMPTIKYDNVN